MHVCELNGIAADAADLSPLAFGGYATFTGMQMRDHAIRGLALHLERLEEGAVELFGISPGAPKLRNALRHAVRSEAPDASILMTLFSRDADELLGGSNVEPDILVRTSSPVHWQASPMRLKTVVFERLLPHLKHADTLALTLHTRQAAASGFDDALFVSAAGTVNEATIWNIAFEDSGGVVWPQGPALSGVTERLIRQGLTSLDQPWRAADVHTDELSRFTGAALMNAWTPSQAVSSIDGTSFTGSAALVERLARSYAAVTPEAV